MHILEKRDLPAIETVPFRLSLDASLLLYRLKYGNEWPEQCIERILEYVLQIYVSGELFNDARFNQHPNYRDGFINK